MLTKSETKIEMEPETEKKYIASVFSPNKSSAAFIIPIAIARRLELDRPCHLIIEEKDNGFFVKKLRIDDSDNYDRGPGGPKIKVV